MSIFKACVEYMSFSYRLIDVLFPTRLRDYDIFSRYRFKLQRFPSDASWENELSNYVHRIEEEEEDHKYGLVVRVFVKRKNALSDTFSRFSFRHMVFEAFLFGLFPMAHESVDELVLLFKTAELRNEFEAEVQKRIAPWQVFKGLNV